MERLSTLARRFSTVDPRSLGLFRLTLGALLVVDLWSRLDLVDTLYSNDGVLSNHYSLFRPLAPYQFSLYAAHSSSRDVMVAFALTLVVYLLFAVGYRTRLFHLLSFVCVTSLHSRNLMAELPSDVPLHLWVGWSLFLPLGARFSIDSVKQSLAAQRERSADAFAIRLAAPVAVSSIAVFGMLLQLSAMHLFAAIRQAGPTWQDGTAIYYALRQGFWVTDLGVWIGEHAPTSYFETATFAYRSLEMLIGLLVLVPTVYARRASVALLLAFHLVSRALWNVGPYEWVMLGGVPLLISSRDWLEVKARYQARKPRLTVSFDGSSGLAVALCRLLKRLDCLERFTFARGAGETGMLTVRHGAEGEAFTDSRALASILSSLPLGRGFGLILLLPGISWLADRTWLLVARRRGAIGAWFGMKALGADPEIGPAAMFDDSARLWVSRGLTAWREAAAVVLLLVCGVALARDMNDESAPVGIEAVVYRVVAYPRLFQRWGLFAPDPPKRPGMLVAEAQTASGAKLNPLTDQARQRPGPLMAAYFTSISQTSRSTYVSEFREYVRRLGDRREPSDKLVWFNVDWIESPIAAPDAARGSQELAVAPVPRRITSGP